MMFYKVFFGKKGFKYFNGYKDDENVKDFIISSSL